MRSWERTWRWNSFKSGNSRNFIVDVFVEWRRFCSVKCFLLDYSHLKVCIFAVISFFALHSVQKPQYAFETFLSHSTTTHRLTHTHTDALHFLSTLALISRLDFHSTFSNPKLFYHWHSSVFLFVCLAFPLCTARAKYFFLASLKSSFGFVEF